MALQLAEEDKGSHMLQIQIRISLRTCVNQPINANGAITQFNGRNKLASPPDVMQWVSHTAT